MHIIIQGFIALSVKFSYVLTALIATLTSGMLWDKINPSATFLYETLFATLALALALALTKIIILFRKSERVEASTMKRYK